MPPRSATRKKSTPARKPTPESKQSDFELDPVDPNNTEFEIKVEESEATEDAGGCEQEAEQAPPPVTSGGTIKQEDGLLDPAGGGEKVVVVSTASEPNVKEELVEEEERGVDVDSERIVRRGGGVAEEDGERTEGVRSEGGHEMNDNGDAAAADVAEKCDNAAEENGLEECEEQIEGTNVDIGGTQLAIVPVADQNACKEGSAAAQIDDAKALQDNENVLVMNEGSGSEGGDGKDEEDDGNSEDDNTVNFEDGEHPSVFVNNHIADRKKEKDLEIFIGRLDKAAVEDDLIKVFGKFGDIRAVRVVRDPATNKSRGFAFIQYATVEEVKNALSALKDGIQVGGKYAKVSASQDNDTLYMGNICKLWTKEHVLETLKNYGIENIEEIHLPDDPQKEGKIKGFALLEFNTHADALAAFQRLRKPDAVFGRDRSAKVAFAQTPMHPNEEVLSQVKTVFLEGLTDAWNEEKVKENCKQYGKILKVKLSRSLGTKRKDYGFVTFISRESALACVEGINSANIGEGDVKVKANIAKPHVKGRLQKQGTCGGFKVTKMTALPSNKAVSTKVKGLAKSKRAKKKAKMVAEEKGKSLSEPEIGRGKPDKQRTVTEDHLVQVSSKLERANRKRKNLHSKAEDRGKTGAEHGHKEKPLKKPQGNKRRRPSDNSRKPKKDPHKRKGSNHGADFIKYRNPSAPEYAASAISYQSHRSKRPHADMEPHAGYLEPVARKHSRSSSGYVESSVGIPPAPVRMQYQPLLGYQQSVVSTQSQPQTGYRATAVVKYSRRHAGYLDAIGTHGQPHAGYLEPAVGRQGRSHAVYVESAVGNYSHGTYDPASRRAGGQDLHRSGLSAYGAGTSLPHSYVPVYTNYVGYEGSSSVGAHYQRSGALVPRRSYY